MAVTRVTTYTDTTEEQVRTGRTLVQAIEVEVDPSSSAEVYVQLYNVANPTPGTTAPNAVIPIPPVARDSKRKRKVVFAGGLAFDTALSFFTSTTHDGATAPTGADAPEYVAVYWLPV